MRRQRARIKRVKWNANSDKVSVRIYHPGIRITAKIFPHNLTTLVTYSHNFTSSVLTCLPSPFPLSPPHYCTLAPIVKCEIDQT